MSARWPLRTRTVVLPADDVDTDQIVPARFLLSTRREGLGRALFADWRFDAQGRPRADSPLDGPAAEGAQALVAGRNFGCGSSREHAAWALADFGFRAVLAPSFADIFRANALKNGLLPVVVAPAAHARLRAAPQAIEVDLAAGRWRLADGTSGELAEESFARRCLLEGVDELGWLLAREADIAAFEARRETTGGA